MVSSLNKSSAALALYLSSKIVKHVAENPIKENILSTTCDGSWIEPSIGEKESTKISYWHLFTVEKTDVYLYYCNNWIRYNEAFDLCFVVDDELCTLQLKNNHLSMAFYEKEHRTTKAFLKALTETSINCMVSNEEK